MLNKWLKTILRNHSSFGVGSLSNFGTLSSKYPKFGLKIKGLGYSIHPKTFGNMTHPILLVKPGLFFLFLQDRRVVPCSCIHGKK